MIKKSKKESWVEFVQKLEHGTHPAVIYETMRKIKGRPPKKIPILSENGQIYAMVSEAAEKFAQTFQQVSSNDNYGQDLVHKITTEEKTICLPATMQNHTIDLSLSRSWNSTRLERRIRLQAMMEYITKC